MIRFLQKEWVLSVLLTFLIVSLAIFIFTGNVVKTESNIEIASSLRTITATGEAGIKVDPDIAYISVGVTTEGKDLEKIQTENTEKMNRMMKILKDEGIDDRNIKTTNYLINPQYQWNETTRKSEMTGYVVSNTVEITIENVKEVGKIIDKMVENGSNQIYGIRFAIKDESLLYNQALELAVKDAHSKAVSMGKGINISNIKVFKISENSLRYQPVYYESNKYLDMATDSQTPISSGELEVEASVLVEFIFN